MLTTSRVHCLRLENLDPSTDCCAPVAASAGHGQLSGIDEEQQITPSLEATAPGSVVLAREQGASSSSSSSTRRPPLDQKRRCMSDRFMM
jgi:hypothetical protein